MYKTVLTILLALATLALAPCSPALGDEKEAELIAVLTGDAPPQDKAITCKHLAIYGSKTAVPALVPLLADADLASWARIALEAIPGPEADAALRTALGQLDGRLLIGTINSIGVRGDTEAVAPLVELVAAEDAEVAAAAAVALGHIGGDVAADALQKSLTSASAVVRSAAAEGCILCAEKRLADDDATTAAALYQLVRDADVPKQRVLEATRGVILADGADGIALLAEILDSDDTASFRLGLTTVRELEGPQATGALVSCLEKASPARQAILLHALADRDDDAVLPALLAAAKAGPKTIRLAALAVLHKVGDATSVPVLLQIAVEQDAEVQEAAKMALESLTGDDIDPTITAALARADGAQRAVLLEMVGRRRIASAAPVLIKAADHADADIRAAALAALGEAVGQKDLGVLIKRVVAPQHTEDQSVAEKALRAACVRMPDREACAAQLAAAMEDTPVATQCTILGILGAMGGEGALDALAAAAKSGNDELQDASTRLLGQWMTTDAAPVLLDLAKSLNEGKYQIRALRGAIRILRQFILPDDQRAALCREALAVATRDDERKLILEVLQRYPSVETLRLTVEVAKTPSLKKKAAAVSLAIAQQIGGGSVDVQQLLEQVGHEPVKIEIIKAEYGAGDKFKDVTGALRGHVRDFPLIVLPGGSYNGSFGGDPVPGTVKQLKIEYRIDGKPCEVTLGENDPVMLPMPK